MQDYDLLKDEGGARLIAVCPIAASMEIEYNERLITAHYFIHDQAKNSYGCQAWSTVRVQVQSFNYDRNYFLTRIAPVDEAVQKAAPTSQKHRLFSHSHYPALARHNGERRIYDSMWRAYQWPAIVNDVSTTVRDCGECLQNTPSEKRRRP